MLASRDKFGRIRPFKCNGAACRYDGRFDEHMAVTRSSRGPRSATGFSIATLYRHFPSRDDLLGYLTHISFEQVLANAQAAQHGATTAAEALRQFIEAAISQRNDLVLPLHGGPPLRSPETRAVREQIHRILRQIIDRGREDGTIRQDVTPRDIVVF